jgi:hypothetical protein
MAYSYTKYTEVAAETVTFTVTFDALVASHIKAKINGVENTAFTLNLAMDTLTFTTSTDIPALATVRVYRDTPKLTSERIVDFANGSVLGEVALDTSAIQNLHIAQEAYDSAAEAVTANGSAQALIDAGLITPTDGHWDAQSRKLTNVSDAVYPQDAVTKSQMDQIELDGGGVTSTQRSRIDSSAPLGGSLGAEFRCLLSTVDVGEDTTTSGFQAALTANGWAGVTDKCAHFYVAKGALTDGGIVRVVLSGRLDAETVGTGLNIRVSHDGTVLGHDDPSESYGYNIGNSWNSPSRLLRVEPETRFTMDLELLSLGSNANLPNRSGTLGHNMVARGYLTVEDYSWSSGEIALGDIAHVNARGYWRDTAVYALEDEVHLHGEAYICCFAHTATPTDKPGETDGGYQYWRPKALKYRIHHMVDWDHTIENEVTIELGRAFQDDVDGYAAWDGPTDYTRGAGIRTGSEDYVCHTPAPSGTPVPTDTDAFWHKVTLRDSITIDTIQAFFLGAGLPGLRSLSI